MLVIPLVRRPVVVGLSSSAISSVFAITVNDALVHRLQPVLLRPPQARDSLGTLLLSAERSRGRANAFRAAVLAIGRGKSVARRPACRYRPVMVA